MSCATMIDPLMVVNFHDGQVCSQSEGISTKVRKCVRLSQMIMSKRSKPVESFSTEVTYLVGRSNSSVILATKLRELSASKNIKAIADGEECRCPTGVYVRLKSIFIVKCPDQANNSMTVDSRTCQAWRTPNGIKPLESFTTRVC